MTTPSTAWDAAKVRKWLESRIVASRLDQAEAQRGGHSQQDDCDKASAEEMVCLQVRGSSDDQTALFDALRTVLDREEFLWRGVYDDARFDRHVRSYVRKLLKMTKAASGFERTGRFR